MYGNKKVPVNVSRTVKGPETISFPSRCASAVLMALCDGIKNSKGYVRQECIEAARNIARQVSREWVNCVESYVRADGE